MTKLLARKITRSQFFIRLVLNQYSNEVSLRRMYNYLFINEHRTPRKNINQFFRLHIHKRITIFFASSLYYIICWYTFGISPKLWLYVRKSSEDAFFVARLPIDPSGATGVTILQNSEWPHRYWKEAPVRVCYRLMNKLKITWSTQWLYFALSQIFLF